MSRHCLCRLIQVTNDTPSLTHALYTYPVLTQPLFTHTLSHTPCSHTFSHLPCAHNLCSHTHTHFLTRYIPPIYPQATILCTPPISPYTTPTSVLALGRFSRMSRSRRLVMLAVAFALTPAQVRIKTGARLELGEIRALDYLSIQ